MKLPIDLKTAKKLNDKGYMSDHHYKKLEGLHKEFEKVAVKLAGGGDPLIPDDPTQWKPLVDQGIIDPDAYQKATQIINPDNAIKEYNTLKSRSRVPMGDEFGKTIGAPQFTDDDLKEQAAKGLIGQAKSILQQSYEAKQKQQMDVEKAQKDEQAAAEIVKKTGAVNPSVPNSEYAMHNAMDVPTEAQANVQRVGMGQLASDTPVDVAPQVPAFDYTQMNAPFALAAGANKESARVAAAKGAEEALKIQSAIDKSNDIQKQKDENLAAQTAYATKEIEDLKLRNEELNSQKIDPSRFWSNASTESKILAGIGLFLGSYGSGGNKAIPVLEGAIKRDVDAQMANIENQRAGLRNRQSLFADNMAIYKNKDMAYAATMSQNYSQMQMQLAKVGAQYSGPEAKAKQMALNAELKSKEQAWDMQLYQMKVQQYAAQNPEKYKDFLPEEKRARLVSGYSGLANSKEGAKEANELNATVNSARNTIDQLIDINKNGDKTDPATRAKAATLSQMLIGQLRAPLFGPGAFSESEQAIAHNIIRDPAAIFSLDASTMSSYNTLKDKLQDMADNKGRSVGVYPVHETMGLKTTKTAPAPYSGGMMKTGAKK